MALARQGHLHRASQTLMHSTILSHDVDVLQQLRDLHPQQDSNIPRRPFNDDVIVVRPDADFIKLVKSMVTGSAPGPTGWSADLLYALTPNDDCLRGIAALITDMINGSLTDLDADALLSSTLLAIPKEGSDMHRPIAISELFYRLARKKVMSMVSPIANELFAPIQYGVGMRDGTENIIHSLRHLLTSPSLLSGLSIDFANAFNSRDRGDILRSVHNNPNLSFSWNLGIWETI